MVPHGTLHLSEYFWQQGACSFSWSAEICHAATFTTSVGSSLGTTEKLLHLDSFSNSWRWLLCPLHWKFLYLRLRLWGFEFPPFWIYISVPLHTYTVHIFKCVARNCTQNCRWGLTNTDQRKVSISLPTNDALSTLGSSGDTSHSKLDSIHFDQNPSAFIFQHC